MLQKQNNNLLLNRPTEASSLLIAEGDQVVGSESDNENQNEGNILLNRLIDDNYKSACAPPMVQIKALLCAYR